jgi:hypothetical protein
MRPSNVFRSLSHARSVRAICQRCGANIGHNDLEWQLEQGAFEIINLRILTCRTCQDKIQPQKRAYTQWRDPLTIEHPAPEQYTNADNPISPIGFSRQGPIFGANIGNLTKAAGIDAAFDGSLNKPASRCASIINSGALNYVGKNWNAPMTTADLPPSITTDIISFSIASFSVFGPSDSLISAPGSVLQLQGSNDGVSWATLYNASIQGTVGEVVTSISSNLTLGNFQQHRVAISGIGGPIFVSQLQLNKGDDVALVPQPSFIQGCVPLVGAAIAEVVLAG